jgi:transposase
LERRYKKKLNELPKNTIILSQDESRFSSESTRITSWSPIGSPVVYSGYKYGTSLNCFGSFNLQTGHLTSSFHKTGNAEATIEHFKKVREAYDETITLAILIDNATWHKTLAVQEYCKENKIILLFLPPYSPEFNPIERVWSFIKSKIRQRFFQTAEIFRSFVFNLFKNINEIYIDELGKQCISLI